MVIAHQINMLRTIPGLGRPFLPDQSMRELIIEFGNGGYIALYRHNMVKDTVYILAFRHQREAGY